MSILSLIFVYNILGDNMEPLKERISITIDSDVLEKVRYEAERDARSLSQYINLVLKEHLKQLEDHKN